jgi:hypothetical protein
VAGVTISNVGLLHTKYLKQISETLNQESKARNLIKQSQEWTGSHLEWVVNVARNPALGYVEDGGAFPVADRRRFVRAKAYRKFVVGSLQLTDGVMATASGSPTVAKDVIESEVDGMMDSLLKYENGMLFRNGDGSVATVKTGTTGTTLIADDARMLWENAVFAVYDSTLATNRGDVQISSVASAPTASNYATVTLVASVPSGTVAGDKLVWKGVSGADDSLNRAITGLDKLIDDAATTFQNVAVSTYPRYSSLVLDNGGSAQDLSPSLFRQMLAGLMQKSGNAKPSQGLKVLTSAWDAINFEEMYEGELRLSPSDTTSGMAVSSFQTSMGKIEVIVDADCLYGKMFFIDPSKIERCVQKELHWRKDDKGGGIFKRSDLAGIYTATAMEICDLRIHDRNTSGKIENLNFSPSTMY